MFTSAVTVMKMSKMALFFFGGGAGRGGGREWGVFWGFFIFFHLDLSENAIVYKVMRHH